MQSLITGAKLISLPLKALRLIGLNQFVQEFEKNLAFKSYCCSNKSIFLFKKSKALQYQVNISIEESKEKYHTKLSSRLADPLTSPKIYWSILKNS